MRATLRSAVFALSRARGAARFVAGKRFARVAQRGSLRLLCSMPVLPNDQSPHDQDELYFVVRGSGVLAHDGRRDRFCAGDAMFIGAGVAHRFEDFTDDLTVWVVFCGPPGGERGELCTPG